MPKKWLSLFREGGSEPKLINITFFFEPFPKPTVLKKQTATTVFSRVKVKRFPYPQFLTQFSKTFNVEIAAFGLVPTVFCNLKS